MLGLQPDLYLQAGNALQNRRQAASKMMQIWGRFKRKQISSPLCSIPPEDLTDAGLTGELLAELTC